MDTKFYLLVFLRRLPYVLLLTVMGAVLGATVAVLLPPVYVAQAKLVVESEQIPGDLAASTVRTAATETLQIIQQRILTRETLLEMANRLDIYEARPGQAARPMEADDLVEDMRERIVIATSGGGVATSRNAPPQATLVDVSFTAGTPQLAATVANEVVTLILSENVSLRTRAAGQTLEFFTQEVERLDQEVARKGAAVSAFQEANRDALPDSLEFRRSRLVTDQERLTQIQRDEAGLRDRRARLVELFESTGSVGLAGTEQAQLTPEQRQLQDLRNQLASLQAVLSPTNPRISVLQNQIRALEGQVAANQGTAVANSADSGLTAYELQLADLDAQLEFLEQQREQIQTVLAELQQTIEATPGNAVTLAELQRDYENTRSQYDQAVQRRAVAETGEMIETLSRGQRISVIEQAVPPAAPESPNRPLIAAAGLGLGVVLGLGLVALLELSDRTIRRPIELTSQLGIQPFAALPMLQSRYDIRRRRLRIVTAFLVVLVVIPGALWLIHSQVVPLDMMADRLLDRLATSHPVIPDTFG
ncbi:GumC family protein [Rubellimicrobium roseum]|nr:lipopolysaccharide biosynthesis protein [Rubellimicrobium roseum]